MTPSDREPTGQRIARARRRRGLSQAVIAGLVGRSESWLSQVERGKRGVDSHSVLVRLAGVLRVDIEELTGSADRDETGRRAYTAALLIEQAMMGHGTPSPLDSGDEPGREASLDFLRAQARSAYQAYQATRYDAAGRILPGLIRRVETAVRTTGTASPTACAVRARVYDTAAALLSRVGEPFLAWAAADRAMFAAGQSGDPLLAAASAWRLSYMITGRKHPREALELAIAAAAALGGATRTLSPERLSVYGALHLAAPHAQHDPIGPSRTARRKPRHGAAATRARQQPAAPHRNSQGSATAAAIELRRSACAAGQPACPQVSRGVGLSGSDREFPMLTARSGMQRAHRPGSHTSVDTPSPWSSSSPQ
jgi:transcriptional regulator with XRE-family HTH domain